MGKFKTKFAVSISKECLLLCHSSSSDIKCTQQIQFSTRLWKHKRPFINQNHQKNLLHKCWNQQIPELTHCQGESHKDPVNDSAIQMSKLNKLQNKFKITGKSPVIFPKKWNKYAEECINHQARCEREELENKPNNEKHCQGK